MTERYACFDVKQFPMLALLRLRPELHNKPVAVLDGEPPFEQVCSLSSSAIALGITVGMTRLENGDVSHCRAPATLARRGSNCPGCFARLCLLFLSAGRRSEQ